MHIRVANANRLGQDIRRLAVTVTPPSFVWFLAANKWNVSHCCNARRRCRSLGAVLAADCRNGLCALPFLRQIKFNITYSLMFCLTVRPAYWCPANTMMFLLSARSVSVAALLTKSQIESQLLWTKTDLTVKVATVSWSRHAAVRRTHHLPWIGK